MLFMWCCYVLLGIFFFKQKTAYEMRISDWSSDVCSSDLLLDLVEQQHAVRMLVDGIGEQPALVEADVARRRADEARDRMPLHVLRHVEAGQLDAERQRELARHLGLADAGRAGEQVAADRLLRSDEHTSELKTLMRN